MSSLPQLTLHDCTKQVRWKVFGEDCVLGCLVLWKEVLGHDVHEDVYTHQQLITPDVL